MAKNAMPLLLVAGGAALLMAGKKKKKPIGEPEPEKKYVEMPQEYGGGSAERLIFDEECNAIAEKIDFHKHNVYVTTRYHKWLEAGTLKTPEEITLQLLKEQSTHCPWDTESQWTDLMRGLYGQLLAAVRIYSQATAGG